jgi:hypothetical protein
MCINLVGHNFASPSRKPCPDLGLIFYARWRLYDCQGAVHFIHETERACRMNPHLHMNSKSLQQRAEVILYQARAIFCRHNNRREEN